MGFPTLFDPLSAAIVIGGTLVASLLQCGFAESFGAARAVLLLGRRRFDPVKARAGLAGYVEDIRKDGVVRGERTRTGDSDIDEATQALIGDRSVAALLESYEEHRAARAAVNDRARATLTHASED